LKKIFASKAEEAETLKTRVDESENTISHTKRRLSQVLEEKGGAASKAYEERYQLLQKAYTAARRCKEDFDSQLKLKEDEAERLKAHIDELLNQVLQDKKKIEAQKEHATSAEKRAASKASQEIDQLNSKLLKARDLLGLKESQLTDLKAEAERTLGRLNAAQHAASKVSQENDQLKSKLQEAYDHLGLKDSELTNLKAQAEQSLDQALIRTEEEVSKRLVEQFDVQNKIFMMNITAN